MHSVGWHMNVHEECWDSANQPCFFFVTACDWQHNVGSKNENRWSPNQLLTKICSMIHISQPPSCPSCSFHLHSTIPQHPSCVHAWLSELISSRQWKDQNWKKETLLIISSRHQTWGDFVLARFNPPPSSWCNMNRECTVAHSKHVTMERGNSLSNKPVFCTSCLHLLPMQLRPWSF